MSAQGSDSIISGGVHDFVRRWIEFVLGNTYRHVSNVGKDWELLESLTTKQVEILKCPNSNVIPFQVNRKTSKIGNDRHVIHLINKLIKQYCIDSELTLPGFYAFLRSVTIVMERFPEAFSEKEI